jgi:hypothetical protein
VPLPFGRAKLPVGTPLKLVSQEGAMLRVRYGNDVLLIPASSTDFIGAAPTPVTAPVVVTPAPAATPAPPLPKESLF